MGEATTDKKKDANGVGEARAEPRPGDDHAYEDSWYQVLKARQSAAEDDATDDDVADDAAQG